MECCRSQPCKYNFKNTFYFKWDLKSGRPDVSLHSVDRLFHALGPLTGYLFCPTGDILKGSIIPMAVLQRMRSVNCELPLELSRILNMG